MSKQQTSAVDSDANSALAYKFWLARCFRDGSPEEDMFRAVCANSMEASAIRKRSPSRQPSSNPRTSETDTRNVA